MGVRIGLIFLFVVCGALNCDARSLASSAEDSGDRKVCKLCEGYVSQAVDYLTEKKIQDDIMASFQRTCSFLGPMKKECDRLVDQYIPLFFAEISTIQPDEFCHSIHFCEKITIMSSQIQKNSCGFCHETVSNMMVKLKDPDTQMEILEMLLKTCNSMGNHAKKECKRLVFVYGPLVLARSEKFLEKTDICSVIHACAAEASTGTTEALVADA